MRNYCLLQALVFHDQATPPNQFSLLTCSCTEALEQSRRLSSTNRSLSEDTETFRARETAQYCIHRQALHFLDFQEPPHSEDDDELEEAVHFLTLDPLLAAVYDGSTYGLVGRKRTPKLQCLLCDRHCSHVHLFHEWCDKNGITLVRSGHLRFYACVLIGIKTAA